MTSPLHILLVEDDPSLGYILKEYLEMNGFAVTLAADGEEGFKAFDCSVFDLCILDVMMPKMDGFALATEIRRVDTETPIIFLTAKSLKVDKLKGFRIGADDYIVKPVDEEELIARIQAITKRSRTTKADTEATVYSVGRYCFDFANQTLSIDGEKITMTKKEAEVLQALCNSQGKILDRKTTLKTLWGNSDYFNRRSMDVFISRLRKYLNKDKSISIRNVHNKGFVLEVV